MAAKRKAVKRKAKRPQEVPLEAPPLEFPVGTFRKAIIPGPAAPPLRVRETLPERSFWERVGDFFKGKP